RRSCSRSISLLILAAMSTKSLCRPFSTSRCGPGGRPRSAWISSLSRSISAFSGLRDSQIASPTESSSETAPAAHRRTRSEPKNSTANPRQLARGPPARALGVWSVRTPPAALSTALTCRQQDAGFCCSYGRLGGGSYCPSVPFGLELFDPSVDKRGGAPRARDFKIPHPPARIVRIGLYFLSLPLVGVR